VIELEGDLALPHRDPPDVGFDERPLLFGGHRGPALIEVLASSGDLLSRQMLDLQEVDLAFEAG